MLSLTTHQQKDDNMPETKSNKLNNFMKSYGSIVIQVISFAAIVYTNALYLQWRVDNMEKNGSIVAQQNTKDIIKLQIEYASLVSLVNTKIDNIDKNIADFKSQNENSHALIIKLIRGSAQVSSLDNDPDSPNRISKE